MSIDLGTELGYYIFCYPRIILQAIFGPLLTPVKIKWPANREFSVKLFKNAKISFPNLNPSEKNGVHRNLKVDPKKGAFSPTSTPIFKYL